MVSSWGRVPKIPPFAAFTSMCLLLSGAVLFFTAVVKIMFAAATFQSIAATSGKTVHVGIRGDTVVDLAARHALEKPVNKTGSSLL